MPVNERTVDPTGGLGGEVWDSLAKLAVRQAMRTGLRKQDAQNIGQDTMAALIVRGQKWGMPEKCESWVLAVAKNLALNELRRQKREAQAYEREGSATATSGYCDEAAQAVARLLIKEALEELPAKERATVIHRLMADKDRTTVSAALDVTVNTVKTSLQRAKRKLDPKLRDSFTEEKEG